MKNIFITHLLIACLIYTVQGNEFLSSRIYYGDDAAEGQFPFMARVLQTHQDNGLTVCGGSLISDQWVVSAAHCAVGAVKVSVTLNQINLKDESKALTLEVPGSNIFRHPEYAPDKYPSPDIVLYKLQEPIDFTKYPSIKPIDIPDDGKDSVSMYDGTIVTAIGWGETETGRGSDTLKYTRIRVMDNSECRQKFSPGASNATICTDRIYKRFSGPCIGDSGGPLIDESSGEQQLLGVTALVVGNPYCSDPNGVSIYTYTPYFLDWIQKTQSDNQD